MENNNENNSIFKVVKNKQNPYVQIDRKTLGDKRLSWKARGILSYILSLPSNWKLYMSELKTHAPDGESSLKSGIKELIKYGYMKCNVLRDGKNRISRWEYLVYEKPLCGNLEVENQLVEIHGVLKNNNTKKNNKKKEIFGDSSNPREHLINPKDSFELKLAKKLKKAIDKKGNINRTIQLKTWSNQIRKLISKSTKSYVKKVILWYCQNIEEKYTPQIYKANDLTDKFKRIEDAMHRAECNNIADAKQNKKTNIKITKASRQIAETLANFGNWPAGCVELLPEVVQTSCNNYREYLKNHFELTASLKTKKQTDRIEDVFSFAHHVISDNENLIDVEWFVERIWLKKIWDNIKGWEGFYGDFRNYTFNINHKRFDAMGKQLALGFCADPKRWGQYKKMLQAVV